MASRVIVIGVLSTAWAALSAMGCLATAVVEEDQPASVDDELSAQATRKCGSHLRCQADQYCAREVGSCTSGGVCQVMPEVCPSELNDPVCGCDGVTYSNACYAAMMGASVKYRGACGAVSASDESP